MKEFAERLKQLQNEMGITQKELAQQLYISETTMSNYILDRTSPTIDVACFIADKLGVTIGWLCGGDSR